MNSLNFYPDNFGDIREQHRINTYYQYDIPDIIQKKIEQLGNLIKVSDIFKLQWIIKFDQTNIEFTYNKEDKTQYSCHIDSSLEFSCKQLILINGFYDIEKDYRYSFKNLDGSELAGFLKSKFEFIEYIQYNDQYRTYTNDKFINSIMIRPLINEVIISVQ